MMPGAMQPPPAHSPTQRPIAAVVANAMPPPQAYVMQPRAGAVGMARPMQMPMPTQPMAMRQMHMSVQPAGVAMATMAMGAMPSQQLAMYQAPGAMAPSAMAPNAVAAAQMQHALQLQAQMQMQQGLPGAAMQTFAAGHGVAPMARPMVPPGAVATHLATQVAPPPPAVAPPAAGAEGPKMRPLRYMGMNGGQPIFQHLTGHTQEGEVLATTQGGLVLQTAHGVMSLPYVMLSCQNVDMSQPQQMPQQ